MDALNSLFLAAIVIVTAFVRGPDKLPAMVYCGACFAYYYSAKLFDSTGNLFFLALSVEVLLVFFLVAINGCLRAKATFWLIGLSVASILMHSYGWWLFVHGLDVAKYNHLVLVNWAFAIGLLLSRTGRNGNTRRHTRFLRRDSRGSKNVEILR